MANIMRRGEGQAARFDPFQVMRELSRWDPFQAREGLWGGELRFSPDFEVKETKDGYLFKADLPGIEEKDVDITMSGNLLTIAGKREQSKEEEGEKYYCAERSYGSFTRSFTLPEGVDGDHIRAEMKNGVLTLLVPKAPQAQPKRIQVQGSKGYDQKGGSVKA